MNYLAHLLLAEPNGPSWIGNLMGDFMTGTPLDSLPPEVRRAVEHHYAVDRFTDRHSEVIRLKSLFQEPYRRCSGIVLDMAFDHCLILRWDNYCPLALQEFLNQVYDGILNHRELLNAKMEQPVLRMIEHNWLPLYKELDGLKHALSMMARRFSFENPLAESYREIERLYEDIQRCFDSFFPQLMKL